MDLSNKTHRELLAKQIKDRINQFCVATMSDGHRSHLGASIIGDECSRKLWYGFRWVHLEKFDGRMLRLFKRGHTEEEKIIKLLQGIGATVNDVDPMTGKQFRLSAVNGHFGGSCDGNLELPVNGEPLTVFVFDSEEVPVFLTEYKTGADKYYKMIDKSKSVAITKPIHFSQMNTYGLKFGLKYAVYIMVNKNNDDLYVEIVELDHSQGSQMIRKAEDIITSKVPPVKLSQDSTFWECKFCSFGAICHYGAPIEQNCRSCVHSEPVEKSQWRCNKHNMTLTKEQIPTHFECHAPIV